MTERGGAVGLAPEALDELLVAGVAPAQHLERHAAVQDLVPGQKYFPLPPLPRASRMV